ncbi:MAG: hypothetical protein R3F23_05965 [Verrucomicrobiia bacterium]
MQHSSELRKFGETALQKLRAAQETGESGQIEIAQSNLEKIQAAYDLAAMERV